MALAAAFVAPAAAMQQQQDSTTIHEIKVVQ